MSRAFIKVFSDNAEHCEEVDPIEDSDIRRFLFGFSSEAERLAPVAKEVTAGSRINLNIGFGAPGQKNEARWEGASEAALSAAIHRLRPFILENERFYYFKATRPVSDKLTKPASRMMLREQSAFFRGEYAMAGIDIRRGDSPLNIEELLHDYLNAFEYHRDDEKATSILSGGDMMFAIRQYTFFNALYCKMAAIMMLNRLISVLLDGGEFQYKLDR